MSSNLYDRIVNQRGSFENLVSRIPLLGKHIESYFDMSAQRDADRIVREHIASQLRAQVVRMADAENLILDSGGLRMMSKTRAEKDRLQTLADRIGTAAPGYAFTGALKISHEQLADVFAFDEAMLRYVDQITAVVDKFVEAARTNADITGVLAELRAVVDEAAHAFDLRRDVINGLA